MTKSLYAIVVAVGLLVALPQRGFAQTAEEPTVVAVNAAYQISHHSFTNANSFPLFGETGSFTVQPAIGRGAMFDIGARRLFWRQLSAGVGVSTFHRTLDASGTATIPNPFFFNQPRVVTTAVTGLEHSEIGIHLNLGWTVPIGDRVDVTLFAGPSFIRTSQDAVPTVTVTNQVATPVIVRQTGTAKGGNFGFDARYRFTNMLGVGLFYRGTPATAHLESISDLKVGGAQAGIGIRLAF